MAHLYIVRYVYTVVAFFIGFLFWKSCKFWRRLRALDYIWKSGVGFTLFYFTNLFVEILGRKGSGTMIFIVSWCYGGLAMVIFILFWQGSYPPWWHHTGMFGDKKKLLLLWCQSAGMVTFWILFHSSATSQEFGLYTPRSEKPTLGYFGERRPCIVC